MPEGPEIRIAADKIERALRPYPTTEVFFAFEHLKPFEQDLTGCRVKGIETRGKAMLTHFDNGLSVYSHNQLYGKWMVRKSYDYPNTNRQLRFAVHNAKNSALLYSASDIQILSEPEIDTHPFLSQLGPDVLSKKLTAKQLQAALLSPKHYRRRLANLYLDQHFLAGIGNYLRSEILFVARLHPKLRPMDCTEEELLILAEASIAIAHQSYKQKGVTNDLDLAHQLKAQGETYREYRHWVFGRSHRPCRICETPIVKDIISSRRIYFCPHCQPLSSQISSI